MMVTINCMSKRSAKMTADALIDEGIAFEFGYLGGDVPCYIEVYDPSEKELQFLSWNFTITAIHKERQPVDRPTDQNQMNLRGMGDE